MSAMFYVFQVCGEKLRFETLMHYFKNYDEFHIDFMVSRFLLWKSVTSSKKIYIKNVDLVDWM